MDVLSVRTLGDNNQTYLYFENTTNVTNYKRLAQTNVPEFIFNGIILPSIAIFGVIGNILNLTILSWRYNKRETDVLERGSLLGLIALAVSDCCFCLGVLPNFVYYDATTTFTAKNLHYYYQVYGIYIHDAFIKISTWLTVIIATARYIALCHPLKARLLIGLFATKVAIVANYVLWFLLLSPLLWSYKLHQYDVLGENVTFYILDTGEFSSNKHMRLSFTYIWALVGYFCPITILAFCNIKLIQALKQSRKWRECSAHSAPSGRDANLRITSTLVALIIMFMILVSPSELIHFYSEVVQPTRYKSFEIGLLCTNLLQTLNFALHFVLYCAVNATFRRTLTHVARYVYRKLTGKTTVNTHMLGRTASLTHAPTSTIFKSLETNV